MAFRAHTGLWLAVTSPALVVHVYQRRGMSQRCAPHGAPAAAVSLSCSIASLSFIHAFDCPYTPTLPSVFRSGPWRLIPGSRHRLGDATAAGAHTPCRRVHALAASTGPALAPRFVVSLVLAYVARPTRACRLEPLFGSYASTALGTSCIPRAPVWQYVARLIYRAYIYQDLGQHTHLG